MNWFSQQTIWLFQQDLADTPTPQNILPLGVGWSCAQARAEVEAGNARWVRIDDVPG